MSQHEQPSIWADALTKLLNDLKSKKEEDRVKASKNLKSYVSNIIILTFFLYTFIYIYINIFIYCLFFLGYITK